MKFKIFAIAAASFIFSASTLLAANTVDNTNIYDRITYNPSVVYNGTFSRNAIYYHNPKNPVWRIGIKKELDYITCRPAQESLRKTGLWSGHFKQDGSCGDKAEPVEWGTGNWLNYNSSRGK